MNYSGIIDSGVLVFTDTAVITSLTQSYFILQLTNNLNEFVQAVICEWDFIDASLTEGEFIKLLWYMTFDEKDQKSINCSDDSIKYMQSQSLESQFIQ